VKKILETNRLFLRELVFEDSVELSKILSDNESMKYYPRAFSKDEVRKWIEWNIDNYQKFGHGLWAVILKDSNVFLGDCGITIQDIEGNKLPELGYHIRTEYQNKGYATEVAKACMDYAFNSLNIDKLYTYTKIDNIPSRKVAEKNGMLFLKEFTKEVNGEIVIEALYYIDRQNGI
jgi:RimJ/RimL family protein N-acetyltransferase